MKKSKKIVALLTILSFLMTLMPFAAFAADGDVSVAASYVETDKNNPTVQVDEQTDVNVGLLDKDNGAPTQFTGKLYVWAETTADRANDALTLTGTGFTAVTTIPGLFVKETVDAGEIKGLKAEFSRAGKYTIKAAFTNAAVTSIADLKDYNLSSDENKRVVTVESTNKVGAIEISGKNGATDVTTGPLTEAKPVSEGVEFFVPGNGVETKELTVKVFKNTDGTESVGRGVKVTFDTNSANLHLDKTEATTGYDGSVKVKVSGDVYGTYKLYVTAEGLEVTADEVTVADSSAAYLEVTKAPDAPFAWDKDFAVDEKGMKDFVRLQVKDINGNVLSKVDGEPAFTATPGEYAKILSQPENANFDDKDFHLTKVKDKDYFTVVANKELKVGKYSLQFALKNGKKAVVDFEIAKFGTAKELKIEYDTETVELGGKTNAPDVYFVDENGVKKDAKNRVTLGYNGYAVDTKSDDPDNGFDKKTGEFRVKDDEKYLGSKVTVTAVAEREGLVAKAEVTVAADGQGMTFDKTSGRVNENNKVVAQLVDGDGKTVALGQKVAKKAIVIQSVSDETAKVSATVTDDSDMQDKGQATLSLTSDKPVTAEFQVYFVGDNGKYYAGNLKYTFGDEPSFAGRTVVMSINSNQVIVDNKIVTIDSAAIIKDSRTFVPFRALAESFGAKVDWDEATQTVTAEMDGKKVEMTVGKKEYKVNDKEMTMDVEPFIGGENRTMIPVRFAAEALGFKVTPTYNEDGTTASVAFNK